MTLLITKKNYQLSLYIGGYNNIKFSLKLVQTDITSTLPWVG